MKEIQLSKQGKNRGKYVALVDDEDFEYLNQFMWHALKHGNTFYALRALKDNGKKASQYMHCAIMGGKGIDHIDHNGLNNQRSNLRLCSQSQNVMNARKAPNRTSVYKGVCFNKAARKWEAQIIINGYRIHLGYFISETDAALAYNEKATELFGEFACLNVLAEK